MISFCTVVSLNLDLTPESDWGMYSWRSEVFCVLRKLISFCHFDCCRRTPPQSTTGSRAGRNLNLTRNSPPVINPLIEMLDSCRSLIVENKRLIHRIRLTDTPSHQTVIQLEGNKWLHNDGRECVSKKRTREGQFSDKWKVKSLMNCVERYLLRKCC